jgi:hypothetical protein
VLLGLLGWLLLLAVAATSRVLRNLAIRCCNAGVHRGCGVLG